MVKKFLRPDFKKLIIYLVFVLIFMSETLLIRSLYQKDYIVEFFLNIYSHFFSGMRDYGISFFTITFICYLSVLFVLYLLSCLVVLIHGKIEK